jgi:hypothetical protein
MSVLWDICDVLCFGNLRCIIYSTKYGLLNLLQVPNQRPLGEMIEVLCEKRGFATARPSRCLGPLTETK